MGLRKGILLQIEVKINNVFTFQNLIIFLCGTQKEKFGRIVMLLSRWNCQAPKKDKKHSPKLKFDGLMFENEYWYCDFTVLLFLFIL